MNLAHKFEATESNKTEGFGGASGHTISNFVKRAATSS